jgi:3-hydroxyacyl-[acyl-carrier-protein] dehydratase
VIFCFGKEFVGFRGHFPGHPVLPAFVQILTGQCAVEARSAQRWALQGVGRAKFMKIILPDQPVTLRWREQPLDRGLRASFSLWVEGQKAATFTLDLVAEGGRHA